MDDYDPQPGEHIGDNIRRLRGKALTRQELAEKAEVSIDLLKLLENHIRNSTSLTTLRKLAAALDCDVSDIVGKRSGLPNATGETAGVMAIRRALSPVDDYAGTAGEHPPVQIGDARRTVTYAWGSYWAGRYEKLAQVLPAGIADLRATQHAAQGADVAVASELYARILWATACTLVHLGHTDTAWTAIRDAHAAARLGNDPLLEATLRGSIGWQLLVQGRTDESRAVVLNAAKDVEPVGDVPAAHLAVYGSLLLQAATASGREQKVSLAMDLADEAQSVATRLPGDTRDYEVNFGPSQVAMQRTDILVSSELYPEALAAAKLMPLAGTGLETVSQARHLLDRAAALTRMGRYDDAYQLVATAEKVGGEQWARHQSLFRSVVAELLDNDRTNGLRELASRIGVRG
ncbi:helix-turn-helix domain-containing protein [Nocardia sp. alder85J]|uniref:helix-turn-helix domain-containing protein n=1 Tax=Nocardia sp. alder85J TaxID=2862949 RepID=UPI001CD2EB49|nr:helix-turn-helix transcriptional regulator [Nocardia sp. alder85J]MCX4099137.1 helix-turn-helix transcriptional regulator [Nocardia sp. alder85J]